MAEGPQGITAITVGGYKSIRDETTIEIRPLTILAGTNCSGKSSIMQPMLMMKQTLDATYDPGPLSINGPNVRFTKYKQFVPRAHNDLDHILVAGYETCFQMFEYIGTLKLKSEFTVGESAYRKKELRLSRTTGNYYGQDFDMVPGMSSAEIIRQIETIFSNVSSVIEIEEAEIVSQRCFLYFGTIEKHSRPGRQYTIRISNPFISPAIVLEPAIKNLIHVPGLRDNPLRSYPVAYVQGPGFPGQFQNYTGSLLLHWMEESDDRFVQVESDLTHLELTRWVKPERVDDANVEIQVGRLPVRASENPKEDLVSIADVGIGVSQVLPVLVSLRAAEPGQLVYVEQPEMHLHPRAQVALATVLADAAKRGVRVVVETHSSLLLQGIMTLIAQDKLDHEDVMLHWFTRDKEGYTKVDSVEPDRNGAYGDWPEDFGDVELGIQKQHLDAVAEREFAT
ncbi:MAG: AAA family ATPase [Anaerolineae bacterium]|nr:AAA family ATPase [Anaerolineae bacterium]